MTKLHLADHLALPPEAVTQTLAILGMRGSGKSNAAVVLAEEMFKAKLHWVAIDPKGDWWGLRSSRDGLSPGLPVVVFGGRHGDVPLEPSAGPLLADLIVDQTMSCVLDLSEFSEGDKIRFLAGHGAAEGFAGRLYRKKSESQPPTHLFLEEADDYLPQKAMRDKAKLLHDCARLFLWGRARGVGGTLITQRSARIHKDALTQAGTLVVFRTTAPQDQKAIQEWVKYHGQSEELLHSLSGLADGECWVWSPEWLKVMKRVGCRLRGTFDSGATPTLHGRARSPATLADVDLSAIRDKMAATIEKAKADDPRELKRRIAELERQLRDRPVAEPVRIEVPVLNNGQLETLAQQVAAIERQAHCVQVVQENLVKTAQELKREMDRAASPPGPTRPRAPANRPGPPPTASGNPDRAALTATELAVLDAAASFPSGATRQRISVYSGRSIKSSSFQAAFPALVAKGLLQADGDRYRPTETGSLIAAPNAGISLADWLRKLTRSEARVLQAIAAAYPNRVTREDVSAATGQSQVSSSFQAAFPQLRDLELIEGRADFRANDTLMRG